MKEPAVSRTEGGRSDMSRREFCRAVADISVVGALGAIGLAAAAETAPAEPESLDEPTPWQEGDPDPVEVSIPEVEPEQTSTEAPPCQTMDDERPDQPSSDHVWVTGYWWWKNDAYLWVPGYWALPPRKKHVYVSGYWKYQGTKWVYVRGGWAKPNSTAIVVYPGPRPVATALVITAPRRIARRHHLWHHYPARRAYHRVGRRKNRRQGRRSRR